MVFISFVVCVNLIFSFCLVFWPLFVQLFVIVVVDFVVLPIFSVAFAGF